MPSPMPAPVFIRYVSDLLNKLDEEKKEQDGILKSLQKGFLNKSKNGLEQKKSG